MGGTTARAEYVTRNGPLPPLDLGLRAGEARHVALEDDVVTVRAGICGAEQAMKHLLCTVFSIEFVGGHRVVRGRQSDASGHPNLFFVKGQSPSTVAHHRVGENKRYGTISGRFRIFSTVENQIR